MEVNNLLENLNSENFYNEIIDISNYLISSDNAKEALRLSDNLERALNKNEVRYSVKSNYNFSYQNIIIKLKFIALPILKENDLAKLINKHFTKIFELDNNDINNKFKFHLLNYYVFEDRDRIKEIIKKALQENNEIITFNANIKKISDWLKNYNSKLGVEVAENIKIIQYFTELSNNKLLNKQDINKLKILFEFYEKLKYSSNDPRGLEDEVVVEIDNKLSIFKEGKLEEIDLKNLDNLIKLNTQSESKENNILKLKNLLSLYPEESLERKAIEEEIKKISKQ